MFRFDSSIRHTTLSVVAAIFFTATMVGAAVGPARVAETAPVASVAATHAPAETAHV